jgi:hypothetical protein
MKKTYKAIRLITKGNLLFRDKLMIDTTLNKLTYWKRNIYGIGHDEIILNFRDIISFRIISRIELFLFCDIEIETRGGRIITANGFLKKDVNEIKGYIGF